MAQNRHYSPVIDRFLVSVLYFDARRHGKPMTRRVDDLLRESLRDSAAWREAEASWSKQANSSPTPSGPS